LIDIIINEIRTVTIGWEWFHNIFGLVRLFQPVRRVAVGFDFADLDTKRFRDHEVDAIADILKIRQGSNYTRSGGYEIETAYSLRDL